MMENRFYKFSSGFTLIELAIVMVIIGLLIGGILGGQSLIKQAALKSIITERNEFQVAIQTFQEQYDALPGDFRDAYKFWGDVATCGTDDTVDVHTCNGNGDSVIDVADYTGSPYAEHIKAWEHLSYAGLIKDTFDGLRIVNGDFAELTPCNSPKSKLSGAYWAISTIDLYYIDPSPASRVSSRVNLSFGQVTMQGICSGGGGYSMPYPLPTLTNGDAFDIDEKIDDGLANKGDVRERQDQTNCIDLSDDPYSIKAKGADAKGNCVPYFLL
jgi:prepilin-type N-terminal cleavage/methylation domain-containing protein